MESFEKELLSDIETTLIGYWLSDLANFCSLLFHRLPNVSWVGFYLSDGKMLRLSSFMGQPACTEISFGRGVCGVSFAKNEILIVEDVHQFPGHIACDAKSRSELVLPFLVDEKKVGVLDLDSHQLKRFSQSDAHLLQKSLEILSKKLAGSKNAFAALEVPSENL